MSANTDYFHLLLQAAAMQSDCGTPAAMAPGILLPMPSDEGKATDFRQKRAGSDEAEFFREDKKVKMDVVNVPTSFGGMDMPPANAFSFGQMNCVNPNSEIFLSDSKTDVNSASKTNMSERNAARRETFRKIANVFNLNDAREFLDTLREYTSEDVSLSAKFLPVESVGIVSLLTYWNMILESYPDAMIEINHVKDAGVNCIEYGLKLSGHRITAQPVNNLFAMIAHKLALGGKVSSEDTLKVVTRSSVTVHTSTASCPFIVVKGKTVLTYDNNGKIIRWFIDIPM